MLGIVESGEYNRLHVLTHPFWYDEEELSAKEELKRFCIERNTVISDNVVIKNRVRIGRRCTIHALTMIGENGFGAYEEENHRKVMVRHYGGVTIAPCTLVAHNARVDDNSVVGIGSAVLEDIIPDKIAVGIPEYIIRDSK